MQKITPFLWFDNHIEEAVNYYTSIFKNSRKISTTYYSDGTQMPAGSILTIQFQLAGQDFIALNGNTKFEFTPAISFLVNCSSIEEVNSLWKKLSENGKTLMELGSYQFSERYGWVQDKYGLSWQIFYTDKSFTQKICPVLMFVGEQSGRAEEAMNFYMSQFKNSENIFIERYVAGEKGPEGTVKMEGFTLAGQVFMAMDSPIEHDFTFSLAISFSINCRAQDEVDMFWDNLSKGGQPDQCGWLHDKYGVSWQVVPEVLGKLLSDKDKTKTNNVFKAMLQMHKLDIETLLKAYQMH